MLQDVGSDHLPILLSVPLYPVFRSKERPPSFNFQKARWDDCTLYFDSHCPSAEKYSYLSSAAALITSVALTTAKSSIPFGCIKHYPKTWRSAEVESAVSERRKAFAAAHRSNEDCRAYIFVSRRASSVIGMVDNLLFSFTQIQPKNCMLSYSLFFLARLPRLLISLTVPLPGNRLRSMPLT